jgi:hypothetical protein
MFILTEDAVFGCQHPPGKVDVQPTQKLVTVEGRRVLVEPDPEDRPIHYCPNTGLTIKPCLKSLKVRIGYSPLLRVEGRRICLDTVRGLTDGTPPDTVDYKVNSPGQELVAERE